MDVVTSSCSLCGTSFQPMFSRAIGTLTNILFNNYSRTVTENSKIKANGSGRKLKKFGSIDLDFSDDLSRFESYV